MSVWSGRSLRTLGLSAFLACSGAESPPEARLATSSASASAMVTMTAAVPEAPPFRTDERVDILIRNGNVCDGSGKACRQADLAIGGDRILHVGPIDAQQSAGRVLDAKGLVVAPGYIDAHAHSDPFGNVDHLLAMGVTTIVVGQDGNSPDERIKAYLDRVDASRPRVNVATLVGHATVRSQENLGMKTDLDGEALGRMNARVDKALAEGAFGLSTGLEYDPGSAAGPAELAAIAEPVGRRGGVVMSHLRSEDDDKVEAAIEELLTQCESAKARAHVAHVKVVLGKGRDRAQKVLDQFQRARDRGLAVTADVYPYTSSYTTLAILFPPYARPPNNYRAAASKNRTALLIDLQKRVVARNGPAAMTFGTGAFAGKTLAQVSEEQRRAFEEILVDLGPSGGSASYKVMDDAVVRAFAKDPFVMFGTDGSGGSAHPRGAGTFAALIAYVRSDDLPLAELARKASALPAETLGFAKRGKLEVGAAADVILFDLKEVSSPATFEKPHELARGMRYVLVNGVIAWADGKPDGRGGKALRLGGVRSD